MRLAELRAQTAALGIEVLQSGKREAKADYLNALRKHQLKQDYPAGLPYQEVSPMLCFPYWDLSPREQREVWESRDWLVQEKLNGCRVILHFIKGVGLFAHSRTINKSDFRRTDLTAQFVFHNYIPDFTAIVDTEVTAKDLVTAAALLRMRSADSRRMQATHTPLTVNVFDIICWEGEDLRDARLRDRLTFLQRLAAKIASTAIAQHFTFPATHRDKKREFFDRVVSQGGEGVVLKYENSRYTDSTTRDRGAWVKVKKSLAFDAYCSGFERGRNGSKWSDYVACLLFSVNTEAGPKLIAKVTNLEWDFRKRVSVHDTGLAGVQLAPSILGRVAKVTGMEFSSRAFRLTHPAIVGWRNDLREEDCRYRLADLEDLRMGLTSAAPMRQTGTVGRNHPQ